MVLQNLEADVPLNSLVGVVKEDGQVLLLHTSVAPPGTFYQLVEDDGAPLPQETALNIVNGTLADNPGVSTDLTLHYQQIEDDDGNQLPQRFRTHYNPELVVSDDLAIDATRIRAPGIAIAQAAADAAQTTANSAGTAAAAAQTTATAAEQPYRATYYVDPNFAGTSTGSSSNPFTTAAAGFSAAVTAGFVSAILWLPPGTVLTENVVFPATGNDWEIACQHGAVGTVSAQINGTVTCTATSASVRYRLTELFVNGAVSGNNTSGTSQLIATRVRFSSTLTLTVTAGGWFATFIGRGVGAFEPNGFSGNITGAVAVTGTVIAQNYAFSAPLTFTSTANVFDGCRFATGSFTGSTSSVDFRNCQFSAATTFTGCVATMDGFSFASLAQASGLTLAGGSTLRTLNSNAVNESTATNNIAATNLSTMPAGVYHATGTLDLAVAGTAGTASLNVLYTDLNGVVQTKPVATLLITSAVGTEGSGDIVFRTNGASVIQFSITGVVTPGTLSMPYAIVLKRSD